MKKKKQLMLIALEQSLGIVTPAAKSVGISRETHYRWIKEDAEYKKATDEINEIQMDFVENALFKNIKNGDNASILFYMKYKGKLRGYTDSIDITTNGKSINEIRLIEVKNNDINGTQSGHQTHNGL